MFEWTASPAACAMRSSSAWNLTGCRANVLANHAATIEIGVDIIALLGIGHQIGFYAETPGQQLGAPGALLILPKADRSFEQAGQLKVAI